jgi:uncharacterized protein YndB with AHSA1/START domain
MASFTVERFINAPVRRVWEELAHIPSIHVWNPGVKHSYATGNEETGLGAARHCDLGGANYLKESVVTFEEQQRLTMRIDETNLPFTSADIRFTLRPQDDGTLVTVSPEYRLKFGPLGALLDAVYVRRTYTKGMGALLKGLKQHVEQGFAEEA